MEVLCEPDYHDTDEVEMHDPDFGSTKVIPVPCVLFLSLYLDFFFGV